MLGWGEMEGGYGAGGRWRDAGRDGEGMEGCREGWMKGWEGAMARWRNRWRDVWRGRKMEGCMEGGMWIL